MPLYVQIVDWTDQGIRTVKDTVKRADAFVAMARKMGCKVQQIVYTMGPHDVVTILEAPDDETMSALSLAVSRLGNIRTLTMRGYTKEEMAKIVGKLR